MNPYLALFSLCALLMTPLTARMNVKIGRTVRYEIGVDAAGVKVWNHTNRGRQAAPLKASGRPSAGRASLLPLLGKGYVKRILRTLRVDVFSFSVRLSFADAASTALVFAALRTALESLSRCVPGTRRASGRVEADFRGDGSELQVTCIISSRLGTLGAAAIPLGMALARERAKSTLPEEENHAAASD